MLFNGDKIREGTTVDLGIRDGLPTRCCFSCCEGVSLQKGWGGHEPWVADGVGQAEPPGPFVEVWIVFQSSGKPLRGLKYEHGQI